MLPDFSQRYDFIIIIIIIIIAAFNKTAFIYKEKIKWLSKSIKRHIKYFVVIETLKKIIFTKYSGFFFIKISCHVRRSWSHITNQNTYKRKKFDDFI
jgi:hypothetical protein